MNKNSNKPVKKKKQGLDKIKNKSKCSRKDKRSSNYKYICNPFTGNWINIEGQTGKKLAKQFGYQNLINYSRKIPSNFEYMLTTNQPALEILIEEAGLTYEDLQNLRATSRWLKHGLDRPYSKSLIKKQLINKIDDWPHTTYRGHKLAKIYHKNKKGILNRLNDKILSTSDDRAFLEDEVMVGYSPSKDEFYSIWEIDIPADLIYNDPSVETHVVIFNIDNSGKLRIIGDDMWWAYGSKFKKIFPRLKEDIEDLVVLY